MLIENISSKKENKHIVAIGIGINLIKSPSETTFPSCNIFEETNIKINPDEFLFDLDRNFVNKINFWNNGLNYGAILEQWIEKAFLLKKEISVTLPNGKKEKGIFSSIDNEGGLILETKNNEKYSILSGSKVEWVEEESYFFKLSAWQDKLLKFYEEN